MHSLFQCIVLFACYRLLPHPANMSPMISICLFSGMLISHRLRSIWVPLTAMFLSDLMIGLYSTLPISYTALILCVMLGRSMKGSTQPIVILVASVAGAISYDLITNAATWWYSGMYAHTSSGLISCYIAALPFMQRSIIGAVLYSTLGLTVLRGYRYLNTKTLFTNQIA